MNRFAAFLGCSALWLASDSLFADKPGLPAPGPAEIQPEAPKPLPARSDAEREAEEAIPAPPATDPVPGSATEAETDRVTPARAERSEESPESSPPFVSLFPDEGLEGWTVHEGRQSAWQREEGLVSCVSAGGGWLMTEREYSDFILRLDYRIEPGGNTGIGLRCPPIGNPTFTGIEVQLLDDSAPKYADLRPDQYTGSLYYQVAARQHASLNPPGEWNRCEIRCLGDELTVIINGETVNEVNLKSTPTSSGAEAGSRWSLSERPPLGRLALQSHTTRVDFRNVEIRDLTVGTDSGLRYAELSQGDGDTLPEEATVTVHYVGQLADGKRFSDSRDLGEPVTVPLTAVIDGWKEGLPGMKVGGRRRLIVPPRLAYGSDGASSLIPPDATLVFEIELHGFDRP
jgi:hypothetical protein